MSLILQLCAGSLHEQVPFGSRADSAPRAVTRGWATERRGSPRRSAAAISIEELRNSPRFVADSAYCAAPHPVSFLKTGTKQGGANALLLSPGSPKDEKIVPDEEGVHLEGEKNLPGAVHEALSELHDEQPELFETVSEWQLIVCNILDEVMFSMNLRDHRAADLLRLEAAA